MNSTVTQISSRDRILYLDVLRFIAIFGVVMLHVSDDGFFKEIDSAGWMPSLFYMVLSHWILPMFIMISGALFLNPLKQITIGLILKKYLWRLIIAYVFWLLAYWFVDMTISWLAGGGGIFKPHFHLWFLPLLMSIYLMVPILREVAKDKKLTGYALLIWIVYLLGSQFLPKEVLQIRPLFDINIVAGYSGYFLLGYYLSQQTIKKPYRVIIYVIGVLAFVLALMGTYLISHKEGVYKQDLMNNLSINVVLICVFIFVAVKELLRKHECRWLCKISDYVRKDLFGIYLCHAIWLIVLNREPFRSLCNYWVSIPLITAAIFIISLYQTKLMRFIPFLRKVVE